VRWAERAEVVLYKYSESLRTRKVGLPLSAQLVCVFQSNDVTFHARGVLLHRIWVWANDKVAIGSKVNVWGKGEHLLLIHIYSLFSSESALYL
jgi:hypothetical protein